MFDKTRRYVFSVPIKHSKKPPIDEILEDLELQFANKLELFSRDLKPGWFSVGDQTLMHQTSTYLLNKLY